VAQEDLVAVEQMLVAEQMQQEVETLLPQVHLKDLVAVLCLVEVHPHMQEQVVEEH
jgi:hypothetical protein